MAYEFNNLHPGATVVRSLDPLVIEKPRNPIHIHTYGGETPFFRALPQGQLLASKCTNRRCDPSGKAGYYHLPPRVYCPDCLEKMAWEEITDLARKKATIHTHITVNRPGAFNRLATPCELISVQIEGVSTILMSYLVGGRPEIGMPIEPRFRTADPTFTILDLYWVPRK
jgi:uncharacterized OB-fold protein